MNPLYSTSFDDWEIDRLCFVLTIVLELYNTVQCCTILYSTIKYSTVQYSTVQYSTVQYSTVQFTVQYCTVHSTVLYSSVQYSCTLLYCTVLYFVGGSPKWNAGKRRQVENEDDKPHAVQENQSINQLIVFQFCRT